MSWFNAWFGYGLGRGAARAVFGEHPDRAAQPPIRQQTESEIVADEKRYDEDARRLAAEDEAAKVHGAG
jgi:hypothetical protein